MATIPFGISRLDSRIGGGAPEGSVVLLSGEAGAGAREFLYTAAMMNAVATADPELFDLHYGSPHGSARQPEEIHYVSFTANEAELQREIAFTMDDEIVAAGADAVTFADLSPEYFQLSPVPRSWYADKHQTVRDLGNTGEDTRDVLERFADYLDEHASGSLVVVDSLNDLIGRRSSDMAFSDVVMTLKGLRKAARDWSGLILLHLTRDAVRSEEFGSLMSSVDGTVQFAWESGGNERVRTMFVREFRGVLGRLEEDDIVQFETEIRDSGFDISDVRKIR
ncbi:HTR-like protein [Halobacterium salinarum]|uniref:RAD55 family ATPase n=1 Tax=Halobacterium salinarum TaxID=2242 RepID=UPI001F2FFD47|nr:HTR-like protein [Halobacterium salinarum]MCF2206625.1 HTR-like protein [Halobacterium salinarum]MCF2241659.1 HTR-like protein [Halobacterium salinarum]